VGKTVVFTPQNLDGSNGTPVNFTIVGVIDGRSPFAYVPYTVGVAMAPPDPNAPQGNYDAAVVEAISVDKVAGVRKAVEALQLHVDTPESVSSSLAGALNTARFIAALVAGIALALAVINITNTLLSAVAERIREIGIMKAIGARNWHIGALFLLESLLLGLTGGLVGGTLAWLMTLTLSNLVPIQLPDSPPITLSLPYATVLVATLAVTVVSGIAGLLPAMRAARTDPVAAITFNH
jgi:ABC-type antimicrobial peptide transport system permease subunit